MDKGIAWSYGVGYRMQKSWRDGLATGRGILPSVKQHCFYSVYM